MIGICLMTGIFLMTGIYLRKMGIWMEIFLQMMEICLLKMGIFLQTMGIGLEMTEIWNLLFVVFLLVKLISLFLAWISSLRYACQ